MKRKSKLILTSTIVSIAIFSGFYAVSFKYNSGDINSITMANIEALTEYETGESGDTVYTEDGYWKYICVAGNCGWVFYERVR